MKNNRRSFKKNARKARGIVLVMILGILSVMVIMAVSFAVAMRTERVATANATENVRTRIMLDTALTRALEDMRLELTNQVYPKWSVRASRMPDDLACSGMGVAFDDFTNGAIIVRGGATNYGILYGSASNYIPRALYNEAVTEDLQAYSYTNHIIEPLGGVTNIFAPRWVPIVEPSSVFPPGTNAWSVETNEFAGGVLIPITNVASRVIGRVGWVIINCSGLLDANFVGGLPRTNGTDTREISLANLPEMNNAELFVADRDMRNVRYDTMYDLDQQTLNSLKAFPNNLFIYSCALSGYVVSNFGSTNVVVKQPVSVAGNETALLSGRLQIVDMFTNMGFSAYQSAILFTNLLDYVDSDINPRLPSTEAGVEPTPFLNEVLVTHAFSKEALGGGAYRYAITNSVQLEFYYPFATAPSPPHPFRRTRVAYSGTGGWIPATPLPYEDEISLEPGKFYVYVCSNVVSKIVGPLDTPPPAQITCQVVVNNEIVSDTITQHVACTLLFGFTNNTSASAPVNVIQSLGRECLDPRLSGNAAMWSNAAAPTIGDVNKATRDYWIANPGCDSNSLLFCANKPLRSIAELGNLPIPGATPTQAWRTINLFGANLHPVLDYFTISTNSGHTNAYRGMVNPNADYDLNTKPALGCVFDKMYLQEHPDAPFDGARVMPWMNAGAAAEKLFYKSYFTNLSEIGKADWGSLFTQPALAPYLRTALERETFFGNFVGLLNTRQNVFLVVLAVELAGQENNRFPRSPARGRAVAVVWRDPYLNTFFVRSFRYLPD